VRTISGLGPVLVAIRFRDEQDAVRIANGTPYGLAAGAWTSNLGRSLRLAHNIHSGQVFVNNYGAGGGVELPFGGVKGLVMAAKRDLRRYTPLERCRQSPSSTASDGFGELDTLAPARAASLTKIPATLLFRLSYAEIIRHVRAKCDILILPSSIPRPGCLAMRTCLPQ